MLWNCKAFVDNCVVDMKNNKFGSVSKIWLILIRIWVLPKHKKINLNFGKLTVLTYLLTVNKIFNETLVKHLKNLYQKFSFPYVSDFFKYL